MSAENKFEQLSRLGRGGRGVHHVNKFEQVPTLDHHMSLAGGGSLYRRAGGSHCSEIQCIMSNGHIGLSPVNRQTDTIEILPSPLRWRTVSMVLFTDI